MKNRLEYFFPEKEKHYQVITFLGRNTEGILNDAQDHFDLLEEAIVIAQEDDQLEAPVKAKTVEVGSFLPEDNKKYLIIANGGITAQILPTISKLIEQGAQVEAYDLQKDGTVGVW